MKIYNEQNGTNKSVQDKGERMTEKAKAKLDAEMMLKWQQYVYREVTEGSNRNFPHINTIVNEEAFIKIYLNNRLSLWIFLCCDGEYGYFDGYTWYEYIPRSIAEFMGKNTLNALNSKEYVEINGKFYLERMINAKAK